MYLNNYVKMSPAGDADSGGSTDKGSDKFDHSIQQIEMLTKSVGLLAEGLQKMEGNQASIIETLAKFSDQTKGEIKHQVEEKFGDDVDFEQLDKKQLAALILDMSKKNMAADIKELLGGVDTKIQNLAASFENKNAAEQVAATADKNADFWEWSNEIKQLLKDNPTLSVQRAYTLAKSENEKKVNELAVKYKKPDAEKKQTFIGLTPTSSIGTRDTTGKMTQKEAAEKAFDKVMGDLGDVLQNGDLKIA